MTDPFLNHMEWRDENANDASGYDCDECGHPIAWHRKNGCLAEISEVGVAWRGPCKCQAVEMVEVDEAEDVAPPHGYPQLEQESDSRLQQAIASAYAAMIQRTLVAK